MAVFQLKRVFGKLVAGREKYAQFPPFFFIPQFVYRMYICIKREREFFLGAFFFEQVAPAVLQVVGRV